MERNWTFVPEIECPLCKHTWYRDAYGVNIGQTKIECPSCNKTLICRGMQQITSWYWEPVAFEETKIES